MSRRVLARLRAEVWQRRFIMFYGGLGAVLVFYGVLSLEDGQVIPPEILVTVGAVMLLYAILALLP